MFVKHFSKIWLELLLKKKKNVYYPYNKMLYNVQYIIKFWMSHLQLRLLLNFLGY